MQQGIYSDFPLKRIFHYEWARLWRTDSIILSAIFFIIVIAIGYGSSFAGNDAAGVAIVTNGMPSVGRLFTVFFVILSLGGDYSQGTFRKRLISGYGRVDILFSTCWMLIQGVILFVLLAFVALLIAQFATGNNLLSYFTGPKLMNLMLIQLVHGSLAVLLISVIQRTGVAILIYFVVGLVEGGIAVYFIIKLQDPGLNILLPLSGGEMLASLPDDSPSWKYLPTPLYVLAFFLISWFKIKKAEF